ITIIVVSGEKGLAGAFNSNILRAAMNFMASKQGKNIDIIAVGKKARDYFRRRYPVATQGGERKGSIQIVAEYGGLLNRVPFSAAREVADTVIASYARATTDAVYLAYNEFKSVISQRLVVDHVLPVEKIGEVVHETTEEVTEAE